MNNSQITPEKDDLPTILRKRQSELVKLIESLQAVTESEAWQNLKTLVLNGAVETLEKRLKAESERLELNLPEIYRLQGQLAYARRTDLNKLIDVYKLELTSIGNKLNENNRTTGNEI